jgi:thioredoxin 1
MDSKAREIDAGEFKQIVLENRKPVMVDFYAQWCGPCRLMSPVLDRLAGEFEECVEIVKIDTRKEGDLCRELQIQALPTVIVFWAGKVVDRLVGFRGEDDLRRELKKIKRICERYSEPSGSEGHPARGESREPLN